MKVINIEFYKTLKESEEFCKKEHPENLAQFQRIKEDILYNRIVPTNPYKIVRV